jgi:glutamate synthase (NADPH/NADH) small chain
MGKPTGFLEYSRKTGKAVEPKTRIKNYNEFHLPLSEKEQKCQGARCMDCGVPLSLYTQGLGSRLITG